MASGLSVRPWLKLEADAVDGVCGIGETVVYRAEVRNSSRDVLRGELQWELQTVAFEVPVIESVAIEIEGRETESFEYELKMDVPGFVLVTCTVVEEGEDRVVRRSKRIACEPTEVLSELTAEPDLEAFWAASIRELGEVEPEYELIEVDQGSGQDNRLYELVMRSHGGVRVRGWLEVPREAGEWGDAPFPAVLRVPGYSQNMRPLGQAGGTIVFSFNIRGHGNSTDDEPGSPADFWYRGLDDKDGYYYRGAFLDCIRAVDYLCTREDVDQDRLVVWGMSQGGGLAFATAALDPRIDVCVADIPWLCDWAQYSRLVEEDDDMRAWKAASEGRTEESVLKTLSYFDAMNLAGLIRCPTLMGVGLQDRISPPSTSFAAFNRIQAPTEYRIYEDRGHGLGWDHVEWVIGELKERFQPKDS